MAYKILLTEDALVDLETILDYISGDDPEAAERFGIAMLNHVELLSRFPRVGVLVSHRAGLRNLLHSPVRIYYRLREDRKLVEVSTSGMPPEMIRTGNIIQICDES